MNILVWGLGYVGTVSAGCLSQLGHNIVGVDINQKKVDMLNNGLTPIKEPGLEDLIKAGLESKKFIASNNGLAFFDDYNFSLICVGTPSKNNGDIELAYLEKVCLDIAHGISKSNKFHNVILRSTVYPGISKYLYQIIETNSQKKIGRDFSFVMNPEFLREASAIDDFYNPPYTVIGGEDNYSLSNAAEIYQKINSPIIKVSLKEAEILKLTNNAFHATKITFANEIGRICEKLNINGQKVMEMVVADKQLNISKVYMRPGFAFGGSCLPKDLRSLTFNGKKSKVNLPLLNSLMTSNKEQIDMARLKILRLRVKSVGILGLSFKKDTDDIRESPVIELIKLLIDDGLNIQVFDINIDVNKMLGENLLFLEKQIPKIKSLLVENMDILVSSKVLVITYLQDDFLDLIINLDSSYSLIDLIGIPEEIKNKLKAQYISLFN